MIPAIPAQPDAAPTPRSPQPAPGFGAALDAAEAAQPPRSPQLASGAARDAADAEAQGPVASEDAKAASNEPESKPADGTAVVGLVLPEVLQASPATPSAAAPALPIPVAATPQ
ncbi:MAG: hypothetical protein K2X11_06170, partial [Acetobacteraceae bacterium]|nr:hypothetical protein [Acetobacteraceae bacterium]